MCTRILHLLAPRGRLLLLLAQLLTRRLYIVGKQEVRRKTVRCQEDQGCPLTAHKAVLITFEPSTKVLISPSLYRLVYGRRGDPSSRMFLRLRRVVWPYGARAASEGAECSTQDASMFNATAREVNHAIKTPRSKPTTRKGLRHHRRLAPDSVVPSRAAARFR